MQTTKRPVERIDKILTLIYIYWSAHPELRLAQIITNLYMIDRKVKGRVIDPANTDPFYFEDIDLEKILEALIS